VIAGELISELQNNNSALVTKKRIRLQASCDDDQAPIYCPADLLRGALSQLVDNAIKFSPEEGLISIHLSNQDEQIQINISDQGPGIAEDDLERIFLPLERLENAGVGVGSGIGLALVQRTLQLMDGKAWASNNDDGGTTFSITFPKTSPPAAE
jgi:signal transduction histidine kinase